MDNDQDPTPRTVAVPASPVRVLAAVKGASSDHPREPVVVLGFGETFADAEFLAISLGDAVLLRRLLSQTLTNVSR